MPEITMDAQSAQRGYPEATPFICRGCVKNVTSIIISCHVEADVRSGRLDWPNRCNLYKESIKAAMKLP
ncbi:putative serine/threonine-protein kinase [Sesbania bispinosa]|nr:putative serine/threonine-protein kinase [Sesbania bispinosa]